MDIFGIPVINTLGYDDNYISKTIKRLESKINVIDDNTWICNYSLGDSGYPVTSLTQNKQSTHYSVHRLIYFMTNQELSPKQYLCHKDDNKLNVCTNNLFIGSARENAVDMAKKFRTHSSLTEANIHHIVYLYEICKWSRKEIGIKFNICETAIGRILIGKSYKHIKRKLFRINDYKTRTEFTGESNKNSKLTDTQVLEIRALHNAENISINALAKLYKVSWSTIFDIVNRNTWIHI